MDTEDAVAKVDSNEIAQLNQTETDQVERAQTTCGRLVGNNFTKADSFSSDSPLATEKQESCKHLSSTRMPETGRFKAVQEIHRRRVITDNYSWLGKWRSLALVSSDLLAIIVGFLLSTFLTYQSRVIYFGAGSGQSIGDDLYYRTWQIVGFAMMLVLCLVWLGQYSARRSISAESKQLLSLCIVLCILDGYIQYTLKLQPSQMFLISTWIFIFSAVLLFRLALRGLLERNGLWQLNTLVVCSSDRVEEIASFLHETRELGYRVVSTIEYGSNDDGVFCAGDLRPIVDHARIDYVLFATDMYNEHFDNLVADFTTLYRIPYGIVSSYRRVASVDMEVVDFFAKDVVLLQTGRQSSGEVAARLKRVFDVVVSVLFCVIFMVPVCLIAVLLKLDGGSVLYRSKRLGLNGNVFYAYKFRSMYTDSAYRLDKLLSSNPAARKEWELKFKLDNDPRITKVGAFLRKSSLDELPQLINVIKGEMSLVGPRPILPDEKKAYGESFGAYSQMKPGVTGVWQVSGRSDVEYKKRIELNNWYARNWSIWGDLMILFRTVVVVLMGKGAR